MSPTIEKHPDSPPSSERFASRVQDRKQARILVVDDEPVICRSMKRILERQGYSVATAESGNEAIGAYRMERFDLVVSDYRMPNMNGYQLLMALKALNPSMRFIAQSGDIDRSEEAQMVAAGAFIVLHKPVDNHLMLAVVKCALDSPFSGRNPMTDNIVGTAKAHARVLYVDDDQDLREAVGDAGEYLGLAIETAGCGKDALISFIKNRPDVVVSDFHMEGMNGLELLSAIKAIDSKANVIIVSGEVNPEEVRHLNEAGAFRVIRKPFDLTALSDVINESLGR